MQLLGYYLGDNVNVATEYNVVAYKFLVCLQIREISQYKWISKSKTTKAIANNC